MKCLILAAGYATRLYPLTENFPKPLLKVGEKTILDWLIDDIAQSNVDEFIVISNHKFAHHFEAWAKAKNTDTSWAAASVVSEVAGLQEETRRPHITVLDDRTDSNESRLGAVRDIQYAIDQLHLDDDLLVIAGDNVLDFSLCKFVDYAREKGTNCTLRYYESELRILQKSGISEIGEGDVLLSLEEKPHEPKSNWCTPPFYFYVKADAARIAEAIADGCGVDAPGSLVAWMCKHTLVHSMEMPGKRYDIGDLKSYENVQRTYKGIQ